MSSDTMDAAIELHMRCRSLGSNGDARCSMRSALVIRMYHSQSNDTSAEMQSKYKPRHMNAAGTSRSNVSLHRNLTTFPRLSVHLSIFLAGLTNIKTTRRPGFVHYYPPVHNFAHQSNMETLMMYMQRDARKSIQQVRFLKTKSTIFKCLSATGAGVSGVCGVCPFYIN